MVEISKINKYMQTLQSHHKPEAPSCRFSGELKETKHPKTDLFISFYCCDRLIFALSFSALSNALKILLLVSPIG